MTGLCAARHTPADAYRHAADMVANLANVTRNRQLTAGSGPVYLRVERVEHLAAELTVLAEQADRAAAEQGR